MSTLKEINPEYSMEGWLLKLKLQYYGHLMWRADSLEKILMLGKIEGKREEGGRGGDRQTASPTQWTWVLSKLWAIVKDRGVWCAAVHGVTKSWTRLNRWHHPDGRKWGGTKKPLDESEIGKWKSWLKAQHSENEDHGIRSHHFMGNRWGNSGNSVRLYFGGAPKSLQMVTAAMKLKDAYSLEEKLWPT